MVKTLQKIGNSKGIVLDKAILELLKIGENGSFELEIKDGGLFLKPVSIRKIYREKLKKHRKSLDKLAK
jgi:antitoxin component of MazEF toxin-antitoxin module